MHLFYVGVQNVISVLLHSVYGTAAKTVQLFWAYTDSFKCPVFKAYFSFLKTVFQKNTVKRISNRGEHNEEEVRRGNEYIDRILQGMFQDRIEEYDPYEIIAFEKKVVFINISGKVKIRGCIGGLRTLHRVSDSFLHEEDNLLSIEAELEANELEFIYLVRVNLMNFGKAIFVHCSLDYVKAVIKFTVDLETGRNGMLEEFAIDDMRGMKVFVARSVLVPFNWAVNFILTSVIKNFKPFIKTYVEYKVRNHIAFSLMNFQFPIEGEGNTIPVTDDASPTHDTVEAKLDQDSPNSSNNQEFDSPNSYEQRSASQEPEPLKSPRPVCLHDPVEAKSDQDSPNSSNNQELDSPNSYEQLSASQETESLKSPEPACLHDPVEAKSDTDSTDSSAPGSPPPKAEPRNTLKPGDLLLEQSFDSFWPGFLRKELDSSNSYEQGSASQETESLKSPEPACVLDPVEGNSDPDSPNSSEPASSLEPGSSCALETASSPLGANLSTTKETGSLPQELEPLNTSVPGSALEESGSSNSSDPGSPSLKLKSSNSLEPLSLPQDLVEVKSDPESPNSSKPGSSPLGSEPISTLLSGAPAQKLESADSSEVRFLRRESEFPNSPEPELPPQEAESSKSSESVCFHDPVEAESGPDSGNSSKPGSPLPETEPSNTSEIVYHPVELQWINSSVTGSLWKMSDSPNSSQPESPSQGTKPSKSAEPVCLPHDIGNAKCDPETPIAINSGSTPQEAELRIPSNPVSPSQSELSKYLEPGSPLQDSVGMKSDKKSSNSFEHGSFPQEPEPSNLTDPGSLPGESESPFPSERVPPLEHRVTKSDPQAPNLLKTESCPLAPGEPKSDTDSPSPSKQESPLKKPKSLVLLQPNYSSEEPEEMQLNVYSPISTKQGNPSQEPNERKSDFLPITSCKSPNSSHPESPNSLDPESPNSSDPESANSSHSQSPNLSDPELPNSSHAESPNSPDPESPNSSHPESPNLSDPESPNLSDPELPNSSHAESPYSPDPESPNSSHPESPNLSDPESTNSSDPEPPEVLSGESVENFLDSDSLISSDPWSLLQESNRIDASFEDEFSHLVQSLW